MKNASIRTQTFFQLQSMSNLLAAELNIVSTFISYFTTYYKLRYLHCSNRTYMTYSEANEFMNQYYMYLVSRMIW